MNPLELGRRLMAVAHKDYDVTIRDCEAIGNEAMAYAEERLAVYTAGVGQAVNDFEDRVLDEHRARMDRAFRTGKNPD